MPVEEYLTVKELAARLKVKPKTIRNKMAAAYSAKASTTLALPVSRHASNGALW
jgi:hypothetical protein